MWKVSDSVSKLSSSMYTSLPVPAPVTALPPSAFSLNFSSSLSFPPSSSSTLTTVQKTNGPEKLNSESKTGPPALVYSCPKRAKRARSEENPDEDIRPSRRRRTGEGSNGASSAPTGSVPSSSTGSTPSGLEEIHHIRSIPVMHLPPSSLAPVESNIVTDMATLFPRSEQARAIRRLWRKLSNTPDPTDQQEPIENLRVYIGYQARKALYTVRVFDKAQKPVLVRSDASFHSDNLEAQRDAVGLLTPDEFPIVLYALDHRNLFYRRIRLSRPAKLSMSSDDVESYQAQWVCPATTRWQVWYEPGRTKASESQKAGPSTEPESKPEFLCEFGGMSFVRVVDGPIKRFTQENTGWRNDKIY